jgi:hypothetical protein
VSGVSNTIAVLLDSVKRVTHGFLNYFATLTITLTVSINGRRICLTISINGCQILGGDTVFPSLGLVTVAARLVY